jgi:thiol:disulfide interchange protein
MKSGLTGVLLPALAGEARAGATQRTRAAYRAWWRGVRGRQHAGAAAAAQQCRPTAAPPSRGLVAEGSEPFSAAHLAARRTMHGPAFIDMTAAWCVTFPAIKRVALAPVRRSFADRCVA